MGFVAFIQVVLNIVTILSIGSALGKAFSSHFGVFCAVLRFQAEGMILFQIKNTTFK